MNEFELSINSLRKRIRLILIERHALAFGAVGAAAAAVAVVLSKKYEALGELWAPAVPIVVGLVSGAFYGAVRKLTPFAVARAVEKRLDLKERLSSVVRLSGSSEPDEVFKALIEDSTKHLDGVDPRTVFPHTFTRGGKCFCFLLILVFGLVYIPQVPAFQTKERREEVRVMKQEGKKLVRMAKELEKKTAKKNEDIAKKVAQNMKALGKKMESGRMSRKQAMLATKKLTKQIEEAQKKLAERNATQASVKTPEEAGKEFQKMEDMMNSELAQKMAQMQARMDKLSELAKAGKLTPEQMKEFNKLSKQLSQMKASGQQMSPDMLKKFADKLANGEYSQAVQSLSEIIEKLKKGEYSKAEMKKLAREVKALSEALKGTPFEKINPELQKAAEALEKGDNKAAAGALEEAQKKAQEIAEQLEDLQKMAKAGAG